MSSEYCAQMVAAYTAARAQLVALSTSLSGCIESLPIAIEYTDKMIINGITIDKGKLKQVSISLDKLNDAFETVIGECDAKIADWQAAYEAALKEEEAARLAAAAALVSDSSAVGGLVTGGLVSAGGAVHHLR